MKGYGKQFKSVPVGSETLIEMKPLDFEEFLWTNGIGEQVIKTLKKCLENAAPVPDGGKVCGEHAMERGRGDRFALL